MASIIILESFNPGPIAMSVAPLAEAFPDDKDGTGLLVDGIVSTMTAEQAMSSVAARCKTGRKDFLVIVDIGGGIGSRLSFISQLKHLPIPVPIVLIADHEAHLDDRVKALGFDVILDRSEMEPICHLKRSHPTVDICHYAFVWPKMADGITLDGMTLQDIIRDIIECQFGRFQQ